MTPTGDTAVPREREPWIQITTAPCALTESGRLECWDSAEWPIDVSTFLYLPIESDIRFRRINAYDSGTVWGLDEFGRTQRVLCGPPVAGFDAPWCDVPAANAYTFEQISHSAGLTTQGVLIDWYNLQQPMSWYPTDRGYRLLAPSHANVALDNLNNLHYGAFWFLQDQAREVSMGDRHILELSSWDTTNACVLDEEGIVSCYDLMGLLPHQPFTNSPYERLRGNGTYTCAQRAVDSVIECNDGRTFDHGPLRDFAVTANRRLEPPHDLELCALDVHGAIHCTGARYPEDLQAALPDGDPLVVDP